MLESGVGFKYIKLVSLINYIVPTREVLMINFLLPFKVVHPSLEVFKPHLGTLLRAKHVML